MTLSSFEKEINILGDILSGKVNVSEARKKAIEEQVKAIDKYPLRFLGFGSVPLGLSRENTADWIKEQILGNNFYGIGEFTLGSGQANQLEPVFAVLNEMRKLPIWVHTFSPLTLSDIETLARLAQKYPEIPVIFGRLGGLNWLETIKMAIEIPNVYLDVSASFTTFALSLALKELPERTLFSSDAPYGDPFLIKTAIERTTRYQYIKEQVLGGTIAKLLNLKNVSTYCRNVHVMKAHCIFFHEPFFKFFKTIGIFLSSSFNFFSRSLLFLGLAD